MKDKRSGETILNFPEAGLASLMDHLTGLLHNEDASQEVRALIFQILEHEQRARLTAETLTRTAVALISTLELDQILDRILEQLQHVILYDSASLMLLEGDELRILAVHGHPFPDEAINVTFRVDANPLSREIVSTKAFLILEDAELDERYSGIGKSHYVRGWMGIPMIVRGQVIGILTLDNRKPNAYTQADAILAMAFANQAGLAISNARLFQSERDQRTMSQALHEISYVLSSSLNANEILETLLQQVGKVVPSDSSCVLLLEGNRATIVAHRGYERYGDDGWTDDFFLLVDQTPNLRSMTETRKPALIPDVHDDPGWVRNKDVYEPGSWLGAPLIAHERLLGFLSLDKIEPGFYNTEHARHIEMLASHAGLALLNALSYGEVEQASITDYLTGAYNHRYFYQQLRNELNHARRNGYPISLLMFDLDLFKQVNDTYGHLVGDKILKLVAARVRKELRAIDQFARYGGEEFAIILPGTSSASLNDVAERLRAAVDARPFQADGHTINISISIGGATCPDEAVGVRALVEAADKALYRAKASGRNRVFLGETGPTVVS